MAPSTSFGFTILYLALFFPPPQSHSVSIIDRRLESRAAFPSLFLSSFSWFLSSIQSVIVLSSSSSPSSSFPKSFRCVAELQVSHFVIVLLLFLRKQASTVASSVRPRLRSRISDISSWSTFTFSRAIFALRLSISESSSALLIVRVTQDQIVSSTTQGSSASFLCVSRVF